MSGVDVGTAYLTVVPSAKGFAGKLQGELGNGMSAAGKSAGSDAAKGFGGSFKSGISNVAKAGALLLAGVAAGGAAFLKDSIGEARESQKVGATTAQIIKATGGAAKISADQVGDLATAISNKTGVDDEAIQSGANMLLTFKNVRNETGKGADVFDRATQAAADLSAAGFGDMAGQSKMLGKALNDPVKGISALGRSGVTFSEQQKEQIKTLVKSGKTLEAQKIILGEVEAQVGGVAEKSSTAGEKLATAWGNFKEGIGTALLPTVDKAANFLKDRLLPGIQGVIDILFKGDFTKGFSKAFHIEEDSAVVGFLFGVRDAFKEIVGGVKAFGAAWAANDGDITSSGLPGFMEKIAGIARPLFKDLVGGVKAFGAAWAANDGDVTSSGFAGFMEKAANAGHKVFDYLKTAIPPIIDSAKKLWPPIKDIATQLAAASAAGGVSTFGLLKAAIGALPGILAAVAPLLESVAKWMGENKDIVAALVIALGAGLTAFRVITGVVKAFTAVQAILNVVMSANPIALVVIAIAALAAGLIYAYNHSETFRNVVDTAFKAIGAAGRWLWNNALMPVIKFIVGGFGTVAEKVGDFLESLSSVPGFGWAKDAADKMHGAAKKAKEFADSLHEIPDPDIDTSKVDAKMAALYKKWSGKALVVQASMHEDVGNGRIRDPKARATGGPVSAGGLYAVGDNPDGSWNKTTELFVPRSAGTIMTQAQIAKATGGGGGLSQNDIDRLAYAMSQVSIRTTVAASSVDRALGANL